MAKVKVPKKVVGVKIPKKVRKRAKKAIKLAESPVVREAAVAALGAIGDERGLRAILAACDDKPAIRRRAVLALAPFDGPEVDAALDRAASDRDWQVRDSAAAIRDANRGAPEGAPGVSGD